MRTQEYNQGELKEIKVKIEKQIAEDLDTMAENSGLSRDVIVLIALKRFRSSHADYMNVAPTLE
jgi:hypothetical protein